MRTPVMAMRTLSDDARLTAFAQAFLELTGVMLPADYLRRGVVRAWYADDRLVAGFACVTRPPFRLLALLPEENLDAHARRCVRDGTACELNGVFIRPEFRAIFDTVAFGRAIMRTFVGSGAAIALFGYNTERANLAPLYQRRLLSPVKLFEGRVVAPGGMVSASNVYLGYLRADHIAHSFRLASRAPMAVAPPGIALAAGAYA